MTRFGALKGARIWELVLDGQVSRRLQRPLFENNPKRSQMMSDELSSCPRHSIGRATVVGALAPRVPVLTHVGGARSARSSWNGPAARTLVTVGAAVFVAVIAGDSAPTGTVRLVGGSPRRPDPGAGRSGRPQVAACGPCGFDLPRLVPVLNLGRAHQPAPHRSSVSCLGWIAAVRERPY